MPPGDALPSSLPAWDLGFMLRSLSHCGYSSSYLSGVSRDTHAPAGTLAENSVRGKGHEEGGSALSKAR